MEGKGKEGRTIKRKSEDRKESRRKKEKRNKDTRRRKKKGEGRKKELREKKGDADSWLPGLTPTFFLPSPSDGGPGQSPEDLLFCNAAEGTGGLLPTVLPTIGLAGMEQTI